MDKPSDTPKTTAAPTRKAAVRREPTTQVRDVLPVKTLNALEVLKWKLERDEARARKPRTKKKAS